MWGKVIWKTIEFIKNGEGMDILKLSSQYFSTGHNFVLFLLGVWKYISRDEDVILKAVVVRALAQVNIVSYITVRLNLNIIYRWF